MLQYLINFYLLLQRKFSFRSILIILMYLLISFSIKIILLYLLKNSIYRLWVFKTYKNFKIKKIVSSKI